MLPPPARICPYSTFRPGCKDLGPGEGGAANFSPNLGTVVFLTWKCPWKGKQDLRRRCAGCPRKGKGKERKTMSKQNGWAWP